MPWVCPCGNTNSSRSPVCLACGRQITPSDRPAKKRGRLLTLSFFGLVVLLLLILASLNSTNTGQSTTANPAPPSARSPTPANPKLEASLDTAPRNHNPQPASTEPDLPRTEDASPGHQVSNQSQSENAADKRALLTELKGSLAGRREYDLYLIRNVKNILNTSGKRKHWLTAW